MRKRRSFRAGGRRAVAPYAVLIVTAGVLAVGAQAEPPLATIGPVTSPGGGAATASGTVGSNGKSDACVNGQHSAANPSSSSTDGAAQVNDSACAASAGSSASGSSQAGSGSAASGAQAAAASRGASSAAGARGARAARSARMLPWVSAAGANGLRIVRVQFLTNRTSATKKVRLVVTLRDMKGRIVRYAIVSAGRLPGAKTSISGKQATFTNRLGKAGLVLPLTNRMLGKRLLLRIIARTPSAHTSALGSVLLPKLVSR